jgi:hypothetical protein
MHRIVASSSGHAREAAQCDNLAQVHNDIGELCVT